MKKIITKTALLAFCLFLSFSAKAQGEFIDGNYTYTILSEPDLTVSVKRFNDGFFYGAVVMPASVSHDSKTYTVTAINVSAFLRCGISSIIISDKVTSIGNFAFSDCGKLTSVTIPDNVTEIGEYAFQNCKALTSITIPDKVTVLGASIFLSCSNLISAKIGNGVTSISGGIFRWCPALATVTIGNSVTSIGDNAFQGSNAIRTIYSRNKTAPAWLGVTFDPEVYSNAQLLIRPGAKGSYQATAGWGFTHIVEDVTVGVDEVDSQAVKVFANGGYINVTGVEDNTPIAIYTLQGGLIYSGICDSTPIEVSGAGLYIARIAGKSYKIAVQ